MCASELSSLLLLNDDLTVRIFPVAFSFSVALFPCYFAVHLKLIAEIHMLMGTPAKAAPEAAQNVELAQAPAQPAAPATEIHAL